VKKFTLKAHLAILAKYEGFKPWPTPLPLPGRREIGSTTNRMLYERTTLTRYTVVFLECLSRLAPGVSILPPGQDSAGEDQS
jgi:hypothetical protein